MAQGSIEHHSVAIWKRIIPFFYVEKGISALETWLNFLTVFFIMFLMFFATTEVVGRYVFNRPVPGHVEIVELIMAAVVFLGIAYTQRMGGHIRMELFVTRVLKGRSYHLAEVLTIFFSLMVYSIIAYYSLKHAFYARAVGDTTVYIYWPTWQSKLCISIGSFLLCIRFFIQLIQHLLQAIAGVENRDLE
jgi:TRAP-type mannitol/chloroaromatic compound transport system permease small subunit